MSRVRVKSDVLCTLLLLLLLGLLLYVQQGSLGPFWDSLRPDHGATSSRTLLGAPLVGGVPRAPPPGPSHLPPCHAEPQPKAKTQSKPRAKPPKPKPKAPGKSKAQGKKSKDKAKKAPAPPAAVPTRRSLMPTRPPFDFEDYLRRKDQRSFKQLIDQPDKCSAPDGAPYMLIAIKSVAADFDKRQVVRRTWGREGAYASGVDVRTVFLLGVPQNRTALPLWDRLLAYESQAFRDILLWDFEDTFFNLTLKETHFLQWVSASCSKVRFIFKGDADVYVNVENILEMLKGQDPDKDLFVGDIIFHARPIRRRNSKYYIPEFVYGQGVYPSYAGGGGFVMSGHTALQLHGGCQQVELFPIDDVFLGMCLLRLGLQPTRHQGFRTFGIVRPSAAPHLQVFEPCFYRELMVVHSLTVPQIWLMWNLLHDPGLRCHTPWAPTPFPFKWRPSGPTANSPEGQGAGAEPDYGVGVFTKH